MRLRTSLLFLASVAACAAPVHLRCNYLENPLGIDDPAPHLSWQSDDQDHNWRQSAYQVLVATNPNHLTTGKPDIWDSGKKQSGESVDILYRGPKLQSSRRYYWTVRVWDAADKVTEPTAPAWWEMGLLSKSDWDNAQWISRKDNEEEADRAAIRWIWVSEQDGLAVPGGTKAVFRLDFDLSETPREAALYLLSRVRFQAKVNGRDAGAKDGRFREFDRQEILDLLHTGKNSLEVTVTTADARISIGGTPGGTRGASTGPAGLAGLLKLTRANGTVERFPTNPRWQAHLVTAAEWKPAHVFADLSDPRIGPDPGPLPGPASLFRKTFTARQSVQSARLYVTALGSYRMFLNGTRIGADVLTPEFTDYAKRVTYQTYDVTNSLRTGENALGALLGDGWFGSGYSWIGIRFYFLPPPTRLLARLNLHYTDGSEENIITDSSWTTTASPILHSEIYAGEVFDSRLEQAGWNQPGFRENGWTAVTISEPPPGVLSAEDTIPVRIVDTVQPQSIIKAPNGASIVDLGQNMAGWARLKVSGPAGTVVRMRFAEILAPDGNIYTENLRNANATDVYILRGTGEEVFEPHFTYHGFRYIEVTGYPGKLSAGAISGQAISSAVHLTGKISTSNELVNRMWHTAIWGQRSNFVSVPTDCPQRDERLGWMGDAQLFWRTGSYNADTAAFGHKWMRDVVDAQTPEGAFTNTSPRLSAGWQGPGTPGWADAGVIVPWTAWLQYADAGIVAENWDAMTRYMSYIEGGNPNYLWKNRVAQNLGDWLPVNSQTPQDLAATAYWAYSAGRMSQMAHAIGKEADAKHYADLFKNIQAAFQKEYIKANAVVGSGSQTSYALALYMHLVPQSLVPQAVDNLVKDIEAHNWHLTTGFLGTPPLLPVLSDNGRTDVAYRLLLNETYPSWGYMLSKGATTWWERWNSDEGDPAMNSFNHFAFGSVVGWIYRAVAGIDTTPDELGFREIILHPHPDSRLTHARGEYDSVYGKIVSDWSAVPNGNFTLNATIPANTKAKVYLPAIANAHVFEDGKLVSARRESGEYVVPVGSGIYHFEVK